MYPSYIIAMMRILLRPHNMMKYRFFFFDGSAFCFSTDRLGPFINHRGLAVTTVKC